MIHDCENSNCCRWFINPQGDLELYNPPKVGAFICKNCLAEAYDSMKPAEPPKAARKAPAKKGN